MLELILWLLYCIGSGYVGDIQNDLFVSFLHGVGRYVMLRFSSPSFCVDEKENIPKLARALALAMATDVVLSFFAMARCIRVCTHFPIPTHSTEYDYYYYYFYYYYYYYYFYSTMMMKMDG